MKKFNYKAISETDFLTSKQMDSIELGVCSEGCKQGCHDGNHNGRNSLSANEYEQLEEKFERTMKTVL